MAPHQKAMQYAHVGIEFAMVFAVFVFAGYYIDEKFASKPWGIIGGLLVGFPVAFYRLLLQAKRMERELSEEDESENQ